LRNKAKLTVKDVYETASKLFSTYGYASTSLQDIADAMGVTRPALYHHFRSKEDILSKLCEEFSEPRALQYAEIFKDPALNPIEKLRKAIAGSVRITAEHPERFRLLDRCENELPEHLRKRHWAAKRAILHGVIAMLTEGMKSGHFRPLDPQVTAFGLIGMTTWIAWWFSPEAHNIENTIQSLTDLAIRGIVAGDLVSIATANPGGEIAEMR
jgi:AcrR family transcriptional regulator